MAKFEGIHWSAKQMRYLLPGKKYDLLDGEAQVVACSRSTNNGAFLAFEGIRFFCKKNAAGRLEVIFLNWDKNLERFRRGMLFNIGADQAGLVPSRAELEDRGGHQADLGELLGLRQRGGIAPARLPAGKGRLLRLGLVGPQGVHGAAD